MWDLLMFCCPSLVIIMKVLGKSNERLGCVTCQRSLDNIRTTRVTSWAWCNNAREWVIREWSHVFNVMCHFKWHKIGSWSISHVFTIRLETFWWHLQLTADSHLTERQMGRQIELKGRRQNGKRFHRWSYKKSE